MNLRCVRYEDRNNSLFICSRGNHIGVLKLIKKNFVMQHTYESKYISDGIPLVDVCVSKEQNNTNQWIKLIGC